MTMELYDPLTYDKLMLGLTLWFERVDKSRLDSIDEQQVRGSGIYALFYTGSLGAYSPISDGKRPIYVGKAVPPGSRKGGMSVNVENPALRTRLNSHLKSVRDAENLEAGDFLFRSLAVVPVWITLAERFLIDNYNPVWNVCLEGFGKHDSGKARSAGKRSWWDVFHPGREWARREQIGDKSIQDADLMLKTYFLRYGGSND